MMTRKPSKNTVKQKIDPSICAYGAGVLLKHRQALMDEIAGVQSGAEDIEFIHRMRVGSRRLRSAFPLFEACLPPKKAAAWLAQVKNVTRALGEARDVDVQIDALRKFTNGLTDKQYRPGLMRLLLRLSQKRRRLQAPLSSAMQALQDSHILEDMLERLSPLAAMQETLYLYTPALYQHGYNAISARLDDLLSYHEIVFQPEQKEALHEMRISAKWLRYTLENLGEVYQNNLKPYLQTVRKAQEMLGDIHDYDVWIDFLPVFLKKERQRTIDFFGSERTFQSVVPGILHFAQDRQALRDERYQQFAAAWQQWHEDGGWDALREVIRQPVYTSPTAASESPQTT